MSGRARFRAGAVGVALLGAFAYLWRLGVPSWQNDEVVYAEAGAALLSGDLTANPEQPPLAKWVFGLAQQVVGDAQLAVRLAAAVGGLAAGLLLYVLVRDLVAVARGAAGRSSAGDARAGDAGVPRASWLGLLAAGLWFALPHTLVTSSVGLDKLDRYGRLEAVAVVPMLAALAVGWRWVTAGGHRDGGWAAGAWTWAPATGALAGLAAAAKPTFGLVLPAVALVALVHRRDPVEERLGRIASSGLVSLGVLLVAYLPHGTGAPGALWRTVRLQLGHAGAGHPVELAGTVHSHAPWWAGLWFTWRDDGPVLTITLTVLVVAAVALAVRSRSADDMAGRGLAVGYLAAAAAVPFVVLAFSPVALPHYRFVWLPQVVALAALGLAALWRWARPAAGVAGLALAGVAAVHLAGIATARPAGYGAAARMLEQAGVADERVLVRGYDRVVARYVPGAVVDALPAAAVVIDRAWAERMPAPDLDRRIGALEGCRTRVDDLTVVLVGRADCPAAVP